MSGPLARTKAVLVEIKCGLRAPLASTTILTITRFAEEIRAPLVAKVREERYLATLCVVLALAFNENW